MRALFVALAALMAAACSSPAPASPTAAPAKPSSAPAAVGSPGPAASPGAAASPATGLPGLPSAATTGSAPSKAEVDAVLNSYYEKARASKETNLVIYGGVPGNEWDELVAEFRKRFPEIQMEKVNLRGPEMLQRLAAEKASGKYLANLVAHGQTTMSTFEQQGDMTQWDGPPTASIIPPAGLTNGKSRWAYRVSLYSAIVNTDLVPKDKMPTGRKDLLDPFWKGKGKLLMEDPRGGGPGLDVGTINYVQLGDDWLKALKSQETTFVRDRDNAPLQVARGEYAMFYPVLMSNDLLELEKVAPVKAVYFTDGGTSIQESTIGVVKDAPGQDAAKLFVCWIESEEGQKLVVEKQKTYSALPGLPPPAGQPPIDTVKPSKRTDQQIADNNKYIEIFDKALFQ